MSTFPWMFLQSPSGEIKIALPSRSEKIYLTSLTQNQLDLVQQTIQNRIRIFK
jgi:hypothetical protein